MCEPVTVYHRKVARLLASTAVTTIVVLAGVIAPPMAAAASCPDVDVIFARGTGERPGLGGVGSQFISKLRAKLRGKKITVYPVNYPASYNFSRSASAGAADASAHIRYATTVCPETRLVLGGMSQGSGVVNLITAGQRRLWFLTPSPLPTGTARHVAAVAVFANPARNIPTLGPLARVSREYGNKSIDLCAPGDPFCSGGRNFFAHFAYTWNGMVDQAATFTANRILASPN